MKRKAMIADPMGPVEAYDRLAPYFDKIADRRRTYLRAIEKLVVDRVQAGSQSLLDVGAGDGSRATRMVREAGLSKVVLLEPSAGMRKKAVQTMEIWPIRAEDLVFNEAVNSQRKFDVITCLWNVLGHIRSLEDRQKILRTLGASLERGGFIFLDVTHRYNVRSYGWPKTMARFLFDKLWPGKCNGDVTVTWEFDGNRYSTFGHVFTDIEVRQLARWAGLKIEAMIVVDYETGEQRRHSWQGNLLYVLRRESVASDSLSVSQTSSISASVS